MEPCEIEVLREGRVVQVVMVGADPVLVGRASSNTLVVEDPLVSGTHAMIRRTPTALAVHDLGSRNGTTVNGARIVGATPLLAGDEVVLGGGTTLRIRHVKPDPAAHDHALGEDTLPLGQAPRHPYALRVSLDAAGGPAALLRATHDGRTYGITAANRATLLFVLARQLLSDREEGVSEWQAGWMDDQDIQVAIWGKDHAARSASAWSVLVHRLRAEIEQGGFDPWFIEKRRGATRLILEDVEVE